MSCHGKEHGNGRWHLFFLAQVLVIVAASHLDAVTFQICSQSFKIMPTALFAAWLLGQRLSGMQWASLPVSVSRLHVVTYTSWAGHACDHAMPRSAPEHAVTCRRIHILKSATVDSPMPRARAGAGGRRDTHHPQRQLPLVNDQKPGNRGGLRHDRRPGRLCAVGPQLSIRWGVL